MTALVPDEPDLQIEDPLTFFLLGTTTAAPRPERPAWQRFYMTTLAAPYGIKWRFALDHCEACAASACVETRRFSSVGERLLGLCLSCGLVAVHTTPRDVESDATKLTGSCWAPADPAVKVLRGSIFAAYRQWANSHNDWLRRIADEE